MAAVSTQPQMGSPSVSQRNDAGGAVTCPSPDSAREHILLSPSHDWGWESEFSYKGCKVDLALTRDAITWHRRIAPRDSSASASTSGLSLCGCCGGKVKNKEAPPTTSEPSTTCCACFGGSSRPRSPCYTSVKPPKSVLIQDIIGVDLDYIRAGARGKESCATPKAREAEEVNGEGGCVVVHYATQVDGTHRLRMKSARFATPDCRAAHQWVTRIHELLKEGNTGRPQRLKVFVNPIGGKKLGPKIFNEKVAPIMRLAGIRTDVVVTSRAHQAMDFVRCEDISSFDGVVVVGGDGMLNEVINGMLLREDRLNIRIGVIPAGSTDTVIFSAIGTNDVLTAALMIVLGGRIPLDVCSMSQNGSLLKYIVSMAGYGFFGDVMRRSEGLRWMGPMRYDYSGFLSFMAHSSYQAQIRYRAAPQGHSPKEECGRNCGVCRFGARPSGNSWGGDGVQPLSSSTDADDGWQTVGGDFVCVNAANISCRCDKSPFGMSRYAHLGNGYADLIMVRQCSRVDYLQHLIRLSGKSTHHDMSFVEVVRVSEFKFSAAGGARSMWNSDGELLAETDIHFVVHRQAVALFGRVLAPSGGT
eukprot:Opistho-1_new@23628